MFIETKVDAMKLQGFNLKVDNKAIKVKNQRYTISITTEESL